MAHHNKRSPRKGNEFGQGFPDGDADNRDLGRHADTQSQRNCATNTGETAGSNGDGDQVKCRGLDRRVMQRISRHAGQYRGVAAVHDFLLAGDDLGRRTRLSPNIAPGPNQERGCA